jgi:hypothetical protein
MRGRLVSLFVFVGALALSGAAGGQDALVEARVRNLGAQVGNVKIGLAKVDGKLAELDRQLGELRAKILSVEPPRGAKEQKKVEEEKPKPRQVKYRPPLYVQKVSAVFFICKEKRMFCIDVPSFQQALRSGGRPANGATISVPVGDYDFVVLPTVFEGKLKAGRVGESADQIKTAGSTFASYLKKLNPKTDRIAFLVYPDSFDLYRAARDMAWGRLFETGWDVKNVGDRVELR